MVTARSSSRVTEAEFLALDEERVELVDGEVFVSPSPRPRHQLVVGALYRALSAWAVEHPPAFVGLSPFDVRIAPGRIVQPDVFVVLAGPPALDELFTGVPDFVVEVLSDRRGHDRLVKRVVYADAGVREYWVVDPEARTAEQLIGPRAPVVVDDQVASSVLHGFAFALGDVLPRE